MSTAVPSARPCSSNGILDAIQRYSCTPRTLRRFRPLPETLESLAPVSSLVPKLFVTAASTLAGTISKNDGHSDVSTSARVKIPDFYTAQPVAPNLRSSVNPEVSTKGADSNTSGPIASAVATVFVTSASAEPAANSGTALKAYAMSASGGSGGSGGGSFGSPAILGTSVTGSAPNDTLSTPNDELPIGAAPTFMVSDGSFASIQWSAGTTVGSDLGAPANQASPSVQGPPGGPVQTNGSSYSFIVQAETPGGQKMSCNISATVPYIHDIENTIYESYVSFSSDPFSVASLGVDHIAPHIQSFITITYHTLRLANKPNPQVPADAGIRLAAQTTTHRFAGQFMFLQVSSPTNATYQRQISDNLTAYPPNALQPNPGFNQDPGTTLGYQTELGANFWEITTANTAVAAQYMNDSPAVYGDPNQYNRLAAGYPSGGTPKSYTTSLMFRPDNLTAVWVALPQVIWFWGAAAILNPGAASAVKSTDQPKAVPSSAVGTWPTWTALASQQTLQAYPGNPWPR